MSVTNHEGVSCDACIKSNFRGRRYKCLMCYDYDLCGSCRDAKVVSGRHTMDHPMQCILTRADMEIYYGGENIPWDQGQSFTCPYCGEMGFNETDLGDHVGLKHLNSINDVLCPICSTMQGGDPNHVTEDLLSHLATDHQANPESSSGRTLGGIGRGRYRRAPPSSTVRTREQRRMGSAPSSASQSATARTTPRELPFQNASSTHNSSDIGESSAALQHLMQPSALASARENVDSIAELLSQLTTVRRAGAAAAASSTSQSSQAALAASFSAHTASSLQQLQMQLQMERQTLFNRVDSLRNASVGRAVGSSDSPRPLDARLAAAYMNAMPFGDPRQPPVPAPVQGPQVGSKPKKERDNQLLLDKLMDERIPDDQQEDLSRQRADQALFIQELLIGTLSDSFDLNAASEDVLQNPPPVMERVNSADSLTSSLGNVSTTATVGSSRASLVTEDNTSGPLDRSPFLSHASSSTSLGSGFGSPVLVERT